jgi:NAD(P)-dependent dehydrogenase (short-subunit alcohol dehydrogenase family)
MAQAAHKIGVIIGIGGMGQAIAHQLAPGRQLYIADYSETGLAAVVKSLQDKGHTVEGHHLDVTDYNSVERLAKAAGAAGQIDAIIHTAGISPMQAKTKRIFEVDVLGFANVVDAFYAVASESTSFVGISSMASYFLPDGLLSKTLEVHLATAPLDKLLHHPELDIETENIMAYPIAKLGNRLRVQAAARAWGSKGARINTISPGVISTPMGDLEYEGESGVYMKAMVEGSGARRKGTSEEIASAAVFLVGPDSTFITGNDILVDGGVVATSRWNAVAAGQAV